MSEPAGRSMSEPIGQPIRVLVADDHPLYLNGLTGLIAATADLELVGQGTDGRTAVALAEELHPDVAVLDLQMPHVDGIEATRTIGRTCPDVGVLILTMYDGDERVFQAMRAGARGYVEKSAAPAVVIDAVRTVGRGGAVFSPALTQRLSEWFGTLSREHGPLARLTPRERDVLDLMARGRDNASIADTLGVSPKTVRNTVSSVFVKLQVADRQSAIAKARGAGLG